MKAILATRNLLGEFAFSIKPRIRLCVVSSWFPSKEHLSCTPFVPAFIRRIRKIGVTVSVITTGKRSDAACELMDEIPIYRTDHPFLFLNMFRLLTKLKPDIIHVHAPNVFSSFAIVAAKLLRIPAIATVHRVEVRPLRNICLEMIRRIVLLLCDQIVTVSKATRRLTEKCGIEASRICVIHNSADEDTFKPRAKERTRKLLRLPLDKEIILFVGRLAPVKGIRYLIRAMPFVLGEREAILVIIGDGPEQGYLRRLVGALNLQPYISLLGHIRPEKLALYYNAADVFVLPSLMEGHSVVLLEAMASGLPIVATGVGGNRESVVNHVNGFLVKPENPEDLAKAIITILDDRKLKLRFSKGSVELYNNSFSERIQLTNYLSLYEALLETRRSQIVGQSEN